MSERKENGLTSSLVTTSLNSRLIRAVAMLAILIPNKQKSIHFVPKALRETTATISATIKMVKNIYTCNASIKIMQH